MNRNTGHKFHVSTFKDSNETQGDVLAFYCHRARDFIKTMRFAVFTKTLKIVINALGENVFEIILEMRANILSLNVKQMLREFHSSTTLFACRLTTFYECYACVCLLKERFSRRQN